MGGESTVACNVEFCTSNQGLQRIPQKNAPCLSVMHHTIPKG